MASSPPAAIDSVVIAKGARVAMIALLMVLAVAVLRASAGDALSAAKPALALVLDPAQSGARVALARKLLAGDATRYEDAVAAARDALDHNPVSLEALDFLAAASEDRGEADHAVLLMALASRIDRRDLQSEAGLLDQDLRGSRVAPALRRIDILLRGQMAEIVGELALKLAPVVTSAAYRPGFVALLQANPPWRPLALTTLARGGDIAALSALFADLQAGDVAPTPEELRIYLLRLTEAGQFAPAYRAWTAALPKDRGGEARGLYNARFSYRLTNAPFDWILSPAPHALAAAATRDGARVLNVDFFGGRDAFAHVAHLMRLAPNAWRFSGRARARGLGSDEGPRWRLFCADDPERTLGVTDPMAGETQWTPFGVDFVVPEAGCDYQELVLERPARAALETDIVGGVSYADLDIGPR